MTGRITWTQVEDRTGERHGIPTYHWGQAPEGLETRRQLRARDLRPVGDPVAQVMRPRRRRDPLVGYLYSVADAVPVQPMTPGRWRSVEAMLTARRTCPTCGHVREYCIPTSLGECVQCADGPRDFAALAA